MSILTRLQATNCIIGSALGKELAQEVLSGKLEVLKEALELIHFNDKNVRAGAAKTLEKVAEKKPELIAPDLEKLLPALDYTETQTRWMIIHVFGLCAKANPQVAVKALEKAKDFLNKEKGTCLLDRTIHYLGYLAGVSSELAITVFPLLENAFLKIPSQTKTVLEAFEKILPIAPEQIKTQILKIAEKHQNDKKPGIKAKALKILKKLK